MNDFTNREYTSTLEKIFLPDLSCIVFIYLLILFRASHVYWLVVLLTSKEMSLGVPSHQSGLKPCLTFSGNGEDFSDDDT